MFSLILDPASRERLVALRLYAEEHPISLAVMVRMASGEEAPIGDNPNHSCVIERGFRVVLSVEDCGDKKFRHMSVSLEQGRKVPHPIAVGTLAKELGFDVGDDLKLTSKQTTMPSPTFGWAVPNVLEEMA